ncbi:MAG TPA: 4Fe-4S dicluster domain-containing protein, partial [Chromatiaceae bacterium]|nr:4Fe-4S dicluster domain-containing protein [Chromatiaceae bacterium]
MPMLPPGYQAASVDDEEALSQAISVLKELVGVHEKPRFFKYDPSLCAHQRNGQTACTRCIDACPAQAITSVGETVEVDSNRCQGGGICATVCPAGAMRYAWPGVEDSLERVKRLISGYTEAGGRDPVLLVVPEAEGINAGDLPSNHLPFEVEELASVGLEFWLGALAYGAQQVRLHSVQPIPEAVESALQQQISVGKQVLSALGYPSGALQRSRATTLESEEGGQMPELDVATFAAMGSKRQLFYTALDHLYQQAERPRPMTLLEAGAPFGTVVVDQERCTLCSACIGACPGQALQAGVDEPAIRFLEANCLQCGLCTRTCPEDAIAISPRLLFAREKRDEVRLLHR